MNDLAALSQKIAALAATDVVFEQGARVISIGGEPGPLAAILGVIDDTILERELEFDADGRIFRVVAAGRRLRGISAVSDPQAETVVGETLSREEPAVLDAAKAVLTRACDAANRLSVRSLPPAPFGKGGERGVSAMGLAELWEVDVDTTPQPPFARFAKIARGAATAMIHLEEGEVLEQKGDVAPLQTMLETQVSAFLARQDKLRRVTEGPQFICLDSAMADGSSTTLALSDDSLVLLSHGADAIPALHRAWKALLG